MHEKHAELKNHGCIILDELIASVTCFRFIFTCILLLLDKLDAARPQKMFRQRQMPLSLVTSQCHHQ